MVRPATLGNGLRVYALTARPCSTAYCVQPLVGKRLRARPHALVRAQGVGEGF